MAKKTAEFPISSCAQPRGKVFVQSTGGNRMLLSARNAVLLLFPLDGIR